MPTPVTDPIESAAAHTRAERTDDDGLAFALDFTRGPLDARISFTRASSATYTDATGVLQSAGTNVARIDYDPATLAVRGLLIEEQRTNAATHSAATGGAAATLPAGWGVVGNDVASLTQTIVGLFTVAGVPVMRIRFNGTPAATTTLMIHPHRGLPETGLTGLVSGSAFAVSAYIALQAGAWPAGTKTLGCTVYRAPGDYYAANVVSPVAPTGTLTRFGGTLTVVPLGGWTPPYYIPDVWFSVPVVYNVPVDFTVDIGLPQLEAGAWVTSPILTTGAAGTRAKDLAHVATAGWFDPTRSATVLFESLHVTVPPATANPRFWGLSDGTEANRLAVARNSSGQVFSQGAVSSSNFLGTGFYAHTMTGGAVYRHGLSWTPDGTYRDAANGTAGGMATGAAIVPGITTLTLGASATNVLHTNGHIRRLRYYTRRMQRDEIQRRTA